MSNGRVLQLNPQVVFANQARRNVFARSEENVKLGRSPGWNLARAERSKFCIYAYIRKNKGVHGVKDAFIPIINTREFASVVCSVSSFTRRVARVLDVPHTRKMVQAGNGHGQDQQRKGHHVV